MSYPINAFLVICILEGIVFLAIGIIIGIDWERFRK
jgi:hypothetical protein